MSKILGNNKLKNETRENFPLVKSNILPASLKPAAKEIAGCIKKEALLNLKEEHAVKYLTLPLYFFDDLLGRKNYLLLSTKKTARCPAAQKDLKLVFGAEINFEEEEEQIIEKAIFLAYQQIKEPPQLSLEFIKEIIFTGYSVDASDIHFTPQAEKIKIDFRIHGTIYNLEQLSSNQQISKENYQNLIRQVKIFCKLDLNEHNLAQEGSFSLYFYQKRELRVRASILPSQFGSSISFRIISSGLIKIEEKAPFKSFGLSKKESSALKEALSGRSGMLLFCGPTGSGKSTLLSAAIYHLKEKGARIVSLEDPIEKVIPDITQVEVDSKKKQRYQDFLPAALRQDPDVICLGEIREEVSAKLALEASLSGHLIISSFHASSKDSAVARLSSLGLNNHALRDSLLLITSQRLVRLNCASCLKPVAYPSYLNKMLGIKRTTMLFKGEGCQKCSGAGLLGRQVIIEISDKKNIWLAKNENSLLFKKQVKQLLLNRKISPESALEVLRG